MRGIVTDRDVALKIVGKQEPFEDRTAADIMTEDVFAVEGDYSLWDPFAEMGDHNVRRIPITEDGKLAGIVTLDDLLAVLHGEMGNVTEVIEAERHTRHSNPDPGTARPSSPSFFSDVTIQG